jgi:nicotinate phosphoribosyltransferase
VSPSPASWLERTGLLLTDLYQLNMLQAYLEHGMTEMAAFEFFVRKLPAGRNFLVAAGLEQAVDFLLAARFDAVELDWLSKSGRFSADFVDFLAGFSFQGDVDAMPEGSLFFADEPIFRLVAPLPVAQLMETRLINLLHFQTVVASKAARMVLAADGRTLVDFGLRRAHGAEAGLLAARAGYLAGFSGTATTAAGMLWQIPIFGTMAHSFIQAHEDETAAFEHFARSRPDGLVLLIDTYDTERGAERVAALAPRLATAGIRIRGVRLDSGDLVAHARSVRAILDAGGLADVTIFASGGLDEQEIARLIETGAPIDGFGVGTNLTTASDAPALDCAYKLQEYAGQPKRKRSEGKATWPGRKQVYRRFGADGRMAGDVLALDDDTSVAGEPLLAPVVRGGRRVAVGEGLAAARARCAREMARLPEALQGLEPAPPYPVEVSQPLRALAARLDAEHV